MTSVSTHIMFQGQGAEALELYTSIFPGFETLAREDYGPDDIGPAGTIKLATIGFNGAILQVIDQACRSVRKQGDKKKVCMETDRF